MTSSVLFLLASASLAQADAGVAEVAAPPAVPTPAAPATGAYEAPAPAPAATKSVPWYDRIKLSGKTFLRYSWDVSSPSNFNEFAIDRIYLTSEYQLTDRFRVQVTLEAGDIRTSGTDNFQVAPKYAFLELKDPLWEGTYVRAGLVHTPFIPYEEDIWGFRSQGKIMYERSGYGSSSDLGLLLGGAFPKKFGSFQVAVLNGETWKKREIGKGKEIAGRVTVKPLAKLGGIAGDIFLATFGDYARIDSNPNGADSRFRFVAQGGISSHDCVLAADYVGAWDQTAAGPFKQGQGTSVFGVLGFHAFTPGRLGDLQLLARFDWLDPDVTVPNNDVFTVLAGVAYRINTWVTVFVDYDSTNSAAAGIASVRSLKLQAEARF